MRHFIKPTDDYCYLKISSEESHGRHAVSYWSYFWIRDSKRPLYFKNGGHYVTSYMLLKEQAERLIKKYNDILRSNERYLVEDSKTS